MKPNKLLTTLIIFYFLVAHAQKSFSQNNSPQQSNIPQPAETLNTNSKAPDTSNDTKPAEIANINQTNNAEKIDKSINIDKVVDNKDKEISAESIKKSIDEIFSPSKLTSLMFSSEQFNNIEKAIEAMRNNKEFVPEGEEIKKLNEEEAKKQENSKKGDDGKNEDNVKSYIYLSSIMFFSENSWSVWVNDKKYISQTNSPDKELFFKNISQNQITIIWKLSISKWEILSGKKSEDLAPKINKDNQVEVEFTLRPNQTFTLGSGKVIDGKASDLIKRN